MVKIEKTLVDIDDILVNCTMSFYEMNNLNIEDKKLFISKSIDHLVNEVIPTALTIHKQHKKMYGLLVKIQRNMLALKALSLTKLNEYNYNQSLTKLVNWIEYYHNKLNEYITKDDE